MPVEVLVMEEGNLQITGQIGEIMQNLLKQPSHSKSIARDLKIDQDILKTDVHIHILRSIPKDGPSAGVTICKH